MGSDKGVWKVFRAVFSAEKQRRRVAFRRSAAGDVLEQRIVPSLLVPALNSLPGAPVTLYLDFDGHVESSNWNNGNTFTTPAFTVDNDPLNFDAEELRRIEEIWYRMSEDYAPWSINVTTVEPATINDFESIRVVFGGDGGWSNTGAYGLAFLNSFSNSASNSVFVFTAIDPWPKNAAVAGSHEVGHAFGLNHQSTDVNTNDYRSGDNRLGPIMGTPYAGLRDTWDNGPSFGAGGLQDDMALISRAANQTVVYRTDDYPSTRQTAAVLPASQTGVVKFGGILETNSDSDFFYFDADAGQVTFTLEGLNVNNFYPGLNLNPGTNLDAIVRLYDSNGVLLVEDDPSNSLGGSITYTASRGRYYLEITSTNEYGSVGQYFVDGSYTPMPGIPTMLSPTGTLSNAVPDFAWTSAAGAASYELLVERRNATTGVWSTYYTRSLTGLTHTAAQQFVQGDFRASVRTVTLAGTTTAYSNVVNFTVDIPTPTAPTIIRPQGDIGLSFPTFEWTAPANASTYNLWVTKVSTGERVIYRTAYAGTTYVHFSALPDGAYRAWVQAVNTVGETSAWSSAASFVIDAPVPAVPTLTAPAALTSSSNPRFTWDLVEAAASYELWVNNLTTGKAQYLRVSDLPYDKNFYDPPVFTQGNYIAWIRAANGNGEYSAWSAGRKFTVDILPPSVPTVTGPVGAAGSLKLITTVNPTFSWTAAARAVRYEIWANNMTTGQYQIIRRDDITTTSYTPLNNLTQGDYRFWVRGINSAGEVGDWSAMYTFTIDEAIPVVPVITDPKANPAGSVENPNPTFIWTMTTKAPYYEIQIDNTTLGKTKVVTATGLTTESFTVPTAQRLGEYAYTARVRAYNASGETSEWSAPFAFRIDVPNPLTPTITGPKDTITDTTPTFSWTHDKNTIRYEILVRDMVRGENVVLNVTSFQLTPNQTEALYTLPDGQALRASTYRFWVRGFNALGQSSNWSLAQAFVIAANDVPVKKDDGQLLVAALDPQLSVFTQEVTQAVPVRSVTVPVDVPVEQPEAAVVVTQTAESVPVNVEGHLIDEVMSEIMMTDALLKG